MTEIMTAGSYIGETMNLFDTPLRRRFLFASQGYPAAMLMMSFASLLALPLLTMVRTRSNKE